jgi:tripartite-type tricarboxylate transporter receptor subunit TctC
MSAISPGRIHEMLEPHCRYSRRQLTVKLAGSLGLLTIAAAALSAGPQPARADDAYPTRPIRLVLPFGAGGIADMHSRLVAAELSKRVGQQVVVENQPGGFGIPAARSVLTAPPDGYTLTLFANGTATSVSLVKDMSFDPVRDFAPISNVVYFDFLMAVNAASDHRSMADFIAAAKAKPGTLNIGTTARGSSSNLAAELLKTAAGIDVTVVPYRNPAELPVALLRNDVAMVLDSYALLAPGIRGGTIRALASTGTRRSAALPDVPTAREGGLTEYEVTSWNGWFAHAKTPPAVIEKLNRELNAIMAQPGIEKKLLEFGLDAHAGTPEELRSRLKSDIAKWAVVIEQAGIEKQ